MDIARECYEAYVIYNFMMFLLNYLFYEQDYDPVTLGQQPSVSSGPVPSPQLTHPLHRETEVVGEEINSLIFNPQVKHIFPLCFLAPCNGGMSFIDSCRHGILQYTVVRPLTTFISV